MMRLLIIFACLPLRHLQLNSGFGYRVHPLSGKVSAHQGVDLHARADTVFAVMDGRTEQVACGKSLGIFIRLSHGSVYTLYGHLSQALVLPGDSVAAGTPIAITGRTGQVTGEHLHFAVRSNGHYIDPVRFLFYLMITPALYSPIHKKT